MFYISLPTFFRPDNTGPYTTLLNFTKKLDIDPCLISLGYFFVAAKFWKLNVCSRVKPPQRCPPRGDPSMHEIWMKKEGSKRWMMRWKKGIRKKRRLTKIDREHWNLSKEWFSGNYDCDQQNLESLWNHCQLGLSALICFFVSLEQALESDTNEYIVMFLEKNMSK